MTEVIHIKDAKSTPDEVWIGPGSELMTPVVLSRACPICMRVHWDSASTLPCFKQYLDWKLTKNDFASRLTTLVGKTLVNNEDGPNHGEIIWDAVRRLTGGILFSPSAIDTAWLCLRKWAFRAIDKAPKESTEAAKLGDDVHKIRENWLNYAIVPPDSKAGKLATVGLQTLPPPRYAMVERVMKLPIQGKSYAISGRIDFFVPNVMFFADGTRIPEQFTRIWGTPGIPLVGDHKTAGINKNAPKDAAIKDWGKTAEDLLTKDAQGSCYGAWAMHVTGANAADLHWSYMIKSDPPKPRPVYARLSREKVTRNLVQNILPTTDHLLTILETPGMTANQVEANPDACQAFGGCPYLDRCAISKEERLRSVFMSNVPQFTGPATGMLNSQLDQMQAQQPQQGFSFPQPGGQPPLAQQVQPGQADYGIAAHRLLNGLRLDDQSPAVQTAAKWLHAQPDGAAQAQGMLQYLPAGYGQPPAQTIPTVQANGQPGAPLFMQPNGVASTSPPGWNPVAGQPGLLQATPNINPPDATLANTQMTQPEEKKKRGKAAAGAADLTNTTQIILLGRIADAVDTMAEAFVRIAAALEKR